MPDVAAAVAFAVGAAFVIAFQVGLALGAPWGSYAMGGVHPGRFPLGLRIAAAVQAIVIGGLVVSVLADAGVAAHDVSAERPWLVWVAVAFSTVSVVLNAITRRAVERRAWLPIAVVMLASSLVVARS